MPTHVFISYAREDRATADALAASLEAGGVGSWIDHRDVEIGMSYATSIATAIGDASAVALVLSARSAESAHVEREVAAAGSRGIPVFVYLEEDVALPEQLRFYLKPPKPFQADVPHEERVAAFTSEVAAAMRGASRAPVSTPAGPQPMEPVAVETIARRLRRTATGHLRGATGLGMAGAVFCLMGDGVAYFEEWVPYAEHWTAPFEDIDLADYIGVTTTFYIATLLLLGIAVRSWALAVGTARALEAQAAPEIIGVPLLSVRRWLQPRAALKRIALSDAPGRAPWSIELWWPALLSSAVCTTVMLVLVAGSNTVPAILIIGLLVTSHGLALMACICLMTLAGIVERRQTSSAPAAPGTDAVRS
jgi:hypothetical protein